MLFRSSDFHDFFYSLCICYVQVYTVGPDYAHAEARKSPALDGKVERNRDGKEIRYPVLLSAKEKLIARTVCLAFKVVEMIVTYLYLTYMTRTYVWQAAIGIHCLLSVSTIWVKWMNPQTGSLWIPVNVLRRIFSSNHGWFSVYKPSTPISAAECPKVCRPQSGLACCLTLDWWGLMHGLYQYVRIL